MYLTNLSKSLRCFNPSEAKEAFFGPVLALMKRKNDQVKQACASFLAVLISLQYKRNERVELIKTIKEELGSSSSFVMRKAYITFCQEAVKVFSLRAFRESFFETYRDMSSDKTAEVRMKFLHSVLLIRPYLEIDVGALLEFNQRLD